MAVIRKFNVIKMSCFLGLFGFFTGLLFAVIATILTFFVPFFENYPIWQLLVGIPIGYGVFMFVMALIFTPLMNLSLRIIKGLDFDLQKAEDNQKPAKTKPVKKQVKTQVAKPLPGKTKKSEPISQMTNTKTTKQKNVSKTNKQNRIPKTPIKPAI